MRIPSRLNIAVVLALVASALAVVGDATRVEAIGVPETLVDHRAVGAAAVEPGFPIDYLGVTWQTTETGVHDEDPGAHGAVRFRSDGHWGPWIELIEDGASALGQWASGLVPAGDADAYQVRGIPGEATAPRAVALNTTDGPPVLTGQRHVSSAGALTGCVSRAEWFADESLRFDADDVEVWPPTFYPAQALTVHHTATANNDASPADTVRAIYQYHAVELGWGDIGYHYLIDEQGLIYEGRWSGSTSDPCGGGADGSDFGHDAANQVVTAGHTGGFNSGNVGVALLGDFRRRGRQGGNPKNAAIASLTSVLTELADRHGLDPDGQVNYVNPVNGTTRTVDTISGHRDWLSTECPGERLYGQLPDIRQGVADNLADAGAPTAAIVEPADGATVSGTIPITANVEDDGIVVQVVFDVDGNVIDTDTDGSDGWTTTWDTLAAPDGSHTVTATAHDDEGLTGGDSATVTVDNVPDTPVHVADLDGSSSTKGGTWTAIVVVSIEDPAGTGWDGATVTGTWSTGGSSSCVTGPDGSCALASANLRRRDDSTDLTITDVAGPGAQYDAGANTDPDADSDGTSITITRG